MNKELPSVLIPQQSVEMSNVDIHTEILEPVNKTQRRLQFNIKKQGLLNSGSRLVLSVHNDDAAADGTCFLPTSCGAACLISKATLRAGTTILSVAENVGERFMIDKAVHTASMRSEIDQVLDGASGCNLGPSTNNDGLLGVDVGCANYTSATSCSTPQRYKPVHSKTNCPLYSISLDEIFVGLKNIVLPVGFMQEQVSVEIELTQQANGETGKTMLFSTPPATTTATSYGLENCVMHLDYLTYDAGTMNRIADQVNSDKGMPMVYSEKLVTSSQLPGVTQPASGQISEVDFVREIGSAGLKVHNVVVTERYDNVNALAGVYRSDSPIHDIAFNWRYNNTIHYPKAIKNPCLMRNELEKVQMFPMSVHNAEYSFDLFSDFYDSKDGMQNNPIDASVLFEGQSPQVLGGNYFITSLNLRKGPGGEGTQIANKNIIYERKSVFSRNDYQTRLIKFFVDYEKTFVLRNGVVLTSI